VLLMLMGCGMLLALLDDGLLLTLAAGLWDAAVTLLGCWVLGAADAAGLL
jgi:hypothetical protein